MNLPEGELHDKTLVDAAIKQIEDAICGGNANQKKESKAYSYKDQLADAELRKELEKKKRKELENKKYTLDELKEKMSKKQQEMLDSQIAKENGIREEMIVKNDIIKKITNVLIKSIKGIKFLGAYRYYSPRTKHRKSVNLPKKR